MISVQLLNILISIVVIVIVSLSETVKKASDQSLKKLTCVA